MKVEIAQPRLTIKKLTQPQNNTKNIAKKYLKGKIKEAKLNKSE
ncbi:hypothetical protein [Bacillus cereus]|nr:hypothetical protein [Bacillus cereus]